MSSAPRPDFSRIWKRGIRLVLLAVVVVLSGTGVLSMTVDWREVTDLYFAHASGYKRYIAELEAESRKRNRAHVDRLAENARLKAVNDSLAREMKALERKIADHKMAFRREIMLDIYGFKRELSVTRDWERGSTLKWKGIGIARVVLHDFWDIPPDTSLSPAYTEFLRAGKPWYVREMLNRVHLNSRLGVADGTECPLQPVSLDTAMNKYGVLITKLTLARDCGSGPRPGFEEFWLGTAADSSRWILELKPDVESLRKLGLGPAYLGKVLDSLMFSQYHYN